MALMPDTDQETKGYYTRGYIPHFDQSGLVQGITFRLADALPAHVLESLEQDPKAGSDPARRAHIEAYLNAGHGACYLRHPDIAQIVEGALLHFDGERYRVMAWVIMPNHVHVLIEMMAGYRLGDIVHSWKSYTAKQANRLLKRSGRFWFREYYDRYIRDERHLVNAVAYIHNNPVQAGLVAVPEDWPFSSAARGKCQQDAGDIA